jgi:hypothetical protein
MPNYANGNPSQNTYIPPPQPQYQQQQQPHLLPSPGPAQPQTPTPAVTPAATDYPYTSASLPFHPPVTPGAMGPPSKPAADQQQRSQKDVGFNDVLAGTDINLHDEEQLMAKLYSSTYLPGAKTGFPTNAPGDRSSFYGAGPANQPGEAVKGQSQEEAEAKAAEDAWNQASYRIGSIRVIELNDPFLQVPYMHYKADKIARDFGLALNLDSKTPATVPFGRARDPVQFDKPTVNVRTKTTEEGVVMNTYGSFVPHDAYLVDQLALLSIAAKHRIRDLLEETDRLSHIRQETSHGKPGEEWESASQPLAQASVEQMQVDLLRSVGEGEGDADGAAANPRKRMLLNRA